MELISTCAEAALVVTVLLAAANDTGARAERTGTALVNRRARENIIAVVAARRGGAAGIKERRIWAIEVLGWEVGRGEAAA